MTRSGKKFAALVTLSAAHGCAASHDVTGGAGGLPLPIEIDDRCQAEIQDDFPSPPKHLSCTGLYRDTAHRVIAAGVTAFTPQYPLWSDNLFKMRYVYLPDGAQIDASDPNYWKFPIGTRVWKEFCYPNDSSHPVETRLYYKYEDNDWRQTTYEWNASLSEATRVDSAKDVMVGDQVHRLPAPNDCEDCHRGRKDRLLGLDQVSLGQPGSTGVTLAKWVSEHRLINFSGPTTYQIGPDADYDSSAEAHALGWMHTNCGVSCHNERDDSKAHMVHMLLRLDPRQLDGRDTSEFDTIKTTVGQAAQSFKWPGQTRIVPGSPDESLLVKLISQRGDPQQQMPPVASNVVDTADVDWVRTWIAGLPK
jgi:hypothetical protein